MTKKVLITGIEGFTGEHLAAYLEDSGYEVFGTSLFSQDAKIYKCDLTQRNHIRAVLQSCKPDYLIHLAGISFAAHENEVDFYRVNTIGTSNLLDAFLEMGHRPQKIVIASSATVYGDQSVLVLDETLCPKPINHYGASKYAMECLARGYGQKLPITIVRPFNYTGPGQSDSFLIPKIVKHYKQRAKSIELGNLDVVREFNDINFVCEVYKRLLEAESDVDVVNIASGRGIALLDVVEMMNSIAGYAIEVKVNPNFVRKNEIKHLTGSNKKLFDLVGEVDQCDFEDTLKRMYEA